MLTSAFQGPIAEKLKVHKPEMCPFKEEVEMEPIYENVWVVMNFSLGMP